MVCVVQLNGVSQRLGADCLFRLVPSLPWLSERCLGGLHIDAVCLSVIDGFNGFNRHSPQLYSHVERGPASMITGTRGGQFRARMCVKEVATVLNRYMKYSLIYLRLSTAVCHNAGGTCMPPIWNCEVSHSSVALEPCFALATQRGSHHC